MRPCNCETAHPSLIEEAILNYDSLPPSLKGWRRFRIEYGFECGCPEGLIYLPNHPNLYNLIDKLEDFLNGEPQKRAD